MKILISMSANPSDFNQSIIERIEMARVIDPNPSKKLMAYLMGFDPDKVREVYADSTFLPFKSGIGVRTPVGTAFFLVYVGNNNLVTKNADVPANSFAVLKLNPGDSIDDLQSEKVEVIYSGSTYYSAVLKFSKATKPLHLKRKAPTVV